MQNQKIENLVKNYNNQNTKAVIISLLVCAILYILFTEILRARYLIWLLLIILPLIIRLVIVYDFKSWANKISKKEKVEPKLINEITKKNNVAEAKIFQSKKEIIFSSFYSLIFLGITIWFWNENIQLKKYGTETIATVFKINSNFYSSHALLEYNVYEKKYTTSIKIQIGDNFSERRYYGRKNIKVKVGQKFKLLYSKKNPKINKIISEYPIE